MSRVQYIHRPGPDAVSTLDFSHLKRLEHDVLKTDGSQHAQDSKVARQFEALLIQQLIKQSRQVPGGGTWLDSPQTRLAQGLQDDQLAMQLADPGLGLAQVLIEQIRQARGDSAEVTSSTAEQANTPPSEGLPPVSAGSDADQDTRPLTASSISELIGLLARPANMVEYVAGAIRSAPNHIHRFVDRMGAAARHAAAASGVPARLILSQAALESGWGRREILHEDGRSSHNLFGIKATGGWKGKVVNVMTTEYENGTARKVVQPFRAYDSYADAFSDYARLISKNSRYSDVLTAPSAEEAARRIQAAGYATDPAYAEKLISIMSYFDRGQAPVA